MKRKALSSAVYSRLTRAVCLADLGRVVQSKFAAAILKRERTKVSDGLVEEMDFKRKSSNGELENFKVCLRHHRDALRETTNFLQYYSDRKVGNLWTQNMTLSAFHQGAFVSEGVALEVLDMEGVFSLFRKGYGERAMDVIRCNLCGKSHQSVHT